MLMTLGMFVFEPLRTPFDESARASAWRHPTDGRLGRRPGAQYLGPGDQTITLTGRLRPQITDGPASLVPLYDMADAGDSYALIDGQGRVRGHYAITSINETARELHSDGQARVIDFQVGLLRVDDEDLRSAAGIRAGSIGSINALPEGLA